MTTASLPDGTVNKSYGPAELQASGGTPPLLWSIAPALPPNLSLNPSTGEISATPITVSPKTNYKVTVTDSGKPVVSSSSEIAIEIKQ
ncbi:MAG: putative Ig domain-containing protein [Acetobacteraceae bacterium]|nr:putative Ig domain-containing protein [Acetobacteraceae bacterium]